MNDYTATKSPILLILAVLSFVGSVLNPHELLAATPTRSIAVKMGDYRFTPDEITVRAGETVQLQLTNTDSLTPHNFTLKAKNAGLNVDTDVSAGKTEAVDITPLVPGSYKFFCNKKLLLFKSHRDRGMEGTLNVTPAGPN
jgi:plastocyanin